MRKITRFEACDGSLFEVEEDAIRHEGMVILAQELQREFGCCSFDPYDVARFITKKYDVYQKPVQQN